MFWGPFFCVVPLAVLLTFGNALIFEPATRCKKSEQYETLEKEKRYNEESAEEWVPVGNVKEAPSETVYHIKNWIRKGNGFPNGWKEFNGIEYAAEK